MTYQVRLLIKGPSDEVDVFMTKHVVDSTFFFEENYFGQKCSVGTFNNHPYIDFSWKRSSRKPPRKEVSLLSRCNSSLEFEMCWYYVERIHCYDGSCITFRNYGCYKVCEKDCYEIRKDYRATHGDILYFDELGNVVDNSSPPDREICKEVASGRFARVIERVGLTYEALI